ncbi:MAG: orotate phosphoribosyltransferase [Saprospiraceae bacterium]
MGITRNTTQQPSVILDKNLARIVAHELLSISAIQLNVEKPFTWVSGIKSPVYCDNRKVNSHVTTRNIIADSFVKLITNNFRDIEVIAGVATGGIPMGILIADRLKLPFVYVRQEPKEHGLMKQVEGDYSVGQNVILIEDHVSTGGSSLKAVNGLLHEGLNVLALVSIMTYNFNTAIDLFMDHSIKHVSLSDLDTVLDQALLEKRLTEEQVESVLIFRSEPKSWKV